jgi:uncharacterized membrane-anchored protein YitT (DUF2179 family)
MAKRVQRWIKDILLIAAAALIFSLGLHCFTVPNEIAPGGVIGIATIINSFLPVSVGTVYALFNVPLIIVGIRYLGKKRMIKTLVSVGVITAATDFILVWANVPTYTGDKILAAIFGGILFGAGLGLIYVREGTSGGIDIVNRIINEKCPHLKMGAIMLVTDAVIITAAMFVFRSAEAGLYAMIAIFVSGRVADLILYGRLEGKLMFVFSEKYDEITQRILSEEGRGVTFLKGTGAYSGEDRNVICCAVYSNQYARIKRKIGEIDSTAFIVIANIKEAFGNGFNENSLK